MKKRLLIDFSASYTERNFITPMRAMTEYLLKQSDLESLPKVLRRSPYESAPPITVYYRKDVEAKAVEVCRKCNMTTLEFKVGQKLKSSL